MGSMSIGTNKALIKKTTPKKVVKPTPIGIPGGETPTGTGNLSGGNGVPLTTNPTIPTIPTALNNKPLSKTLLKYVTNDSTYQGQYAALNKAYSDYAAQKAATEGEYNTNYQNNARDLTKAQDVATRDQADDYASRGIYRSGVFATAAGNLSNDYTNRASDLLTGKTQQLSQSNRDFQNFTASNMLAKQQAVQDSISRRALGLITGSK